MRCLALAEALTEQHVECRFIMHADSIEFCHARIEWCWPKLIIPDDIRIDEEQHWLQNQITFAEEDILILDGYQFDATYINDLQTFAVPVLLFDDNNNRGEVTVQMVINSAANAESLQYETTMPGATFCLGDKFRLLRKEFRTELPQPVQQRHSIAIIMGGSDPKGLIIPLLKELHQQQSDYPVRVLVNSNYQPLDELKQKIPQWHFATQLVVNGADIANIFNNSKLVISAAGGTQFELMAMHTPAILLSVADNQVNATQQSELQGWCEHIDCREQTPFADIISRAQQLLEQPEKLQQMQNNAQQYADYDGVERLLDAILGLSDQPEATP